MPRQERKVLHLFWLNIYIYPFSLPPSFFEIKLVPRA